MPEPTPKRWFVPPPIAFAILAASCVLPSFAQQSNDTTVPSSARGIVNRGVALTMGSNALSVIDYAGGHYVFPAKSGPVISEATLVDQSGNASKGSLVVSSTKTDPVANTITQTYSWGVVTTAYSTLSNRLKVSVAVRNLSSVNTITHLRMFPMGIAFPQTPTYPSGSNVVFNTDTPSVVYFNFGLGAVALVNDDLGLPLATGLWPAQSPVGTNWQLMLDFDNGHTVSNWPTVPRPIGPLASDQYFVSLRFGSGSSTVNQLAGDIDGSFARAFPPQVSIPKARPIADLIMSGRLRGAAAIANSCKCLTNPRGWFSDPTVDVISSQGIAAFQARLLKYADNSIAEITRVGAQGVILWDLEGQGTDEAYVGDPSQIESMAPELVGILDTFVNKFISAGLNVGFTIRPQVFNTQSGFVSTSGAVLTWSGGTQFDPSWLPGTQVTGSMTIGANSYQIQSVDSPTQITLTKPVSDMDAGTGVAYLYVTHTTPADPGAVMNGKIQYAQNRWGTNALLFYIDSNLTHDGVINGADYFAALLNNFPGVMLFPEWKSVRHYAYTYPYIDPANGSLGPSAQALAVYPAALSLIKVSDPVAKTYPAQLLNLARAGNILLFDGWYRHPANDAIQQIYSQIQ